MSLDLLPSDSRGLAPVEFVWVRAAGKRGAYQWVERRKKGLFGEAPGLVLAWRAGSQLGGYKPLEDEHGLFLTFAATDPSPEGTLRFADRYGPLGYSVSTPVQLTDTDHLPIFYPGDAPETLVRRTGTEVRGRMEIFAEWRDAILWMRHLTTLWQLAQTHNRPKLSDFVHWDGERVIHRFPPIDTFGTGTDERKDGKEVWADAQLRTPEGEALFPKGDLAGPALLFVMRAVNTQLRRGVSARLYWSVGRRRPEMTYAPNELLEAMYLQFAQAIDRGWKFRQCPVCQETFRVARDAKRSNRVTCSTTCRTYLYRSRMKEAQELHRQGKPVKQIAKELNAEVETIKNWIAKGE